MVNNGDSRHGSNWVKLREAQTMTLQLPNMGMAVMLDIGKGLAADDNGEVNLYNREGFPAVPFRTDT